VRIIGVSRRAYYISVEGVNSTTVFGAEWGTQGIPGNDPTIPEFPNLIGYVDIFAQFMAVSLIYLYGVTLLLGFSLTGPFVIMVAKMMSGDVTRWSVVFIVMWMGFSTTFLALQSVPRQTWMTGWDQMWANLVGLYQILMASGDLNAFVMMIAQDWSLFFDIGAKMLIATYSVLMAVMMLNLLIAMMMDTYAVVKETTEIQYIQFKAQIISSLENEMGVKDWQNVAPYWIMDKGEPWLQMQIKDETFLKPAVAAAGGGGEFVVPTLPPAPVVPVKTADQEFAEADADHDGKISQQELKAKELKLRAQVEQELQQKYAHVINRVAAPPPTTQSGYVNVGDLGDDFNRRGVYRVDQ